MYYQFIINLLSKIDLETELLEEPLVLSSLVLLLQNLLDGLASLTLLGRVLQQVHSDGLLQVSIKAVTGGHQVGIVDELDEGLDTATTGDLLVAHGFGDLEGVTFQAADQGRAELLATGFVILFER